MGLRPDGPRLLVCGHTNLDYIGEVERFPEPNTSIEMVSQKRYFGGTGANISRSAARLGAAVRLYSLVGGDFPADYKEALEEDGVDLSGLVVVEGALTPTCLILSDRNHDQIAIINQGPMASPERAVLPPGLLDDVGVVHISTGRPEHYIRMVEEAVQRGIPVFLDPAQELHYVYSPEMFARMLSLSTGLFCNESEMSRALGYLGLETEEDLAGRVALLVVTRKDRGSTVYYDPESGLFDCVLPGGDHWCSGCRRVRLDIPLVAAERVVDTTGAGDAYRGGFYAAWARDLDVWKSALFASAAASFVVEAKGPQMSLPTWDMVKARLAERGWSVG